MAENTKNVAFNGHAVVVLQYLYVYDASVVYRAYFLAVEHIAFGTYVNSLDILL